jgi:ATP-dependent helicase/nuclease subunit A
MATSAGGLAVKVATSPAKQVDQTRWTREQQLAIETRQVSVALSAGAGCGKTFALTERFLSYFRPGQPQSLQAEDLGRLVAITFTERAAREMRDRIRAQCHERLLAADAGDADYWAVLVRGLDNARISTIHSFCAALLRARAVEAGVDPRFEVLEQSQSDTLLSEAIDDELRRLVAQQDPRLMELAAAFRLDSLRFALRTFVLQGTAEDFERWLQIGPDEQVARWLEFHRESVLPEIGRQVAHCSASHEILRLLQNETIDNATMRERRGVLLEKLASLDRLPVAGARLRADLNAIQENAKVQGGGTARTWASPVAFERFKHAAGKLRERIGELLPLVSFDPLAARSSAVVGGQMLGIADGVRREYSRRKQEMGALDFNDLLQQTRALLTDPRHGALQDRLSSQIQLLLVDEFQDTDPLQVELVAALCGEGFAAGKLFFVGDYKQSIYRFRGADARVFRRVREQTPREGRQSLTKNFRSQPAILEFVNALFWDDLGEGYEPLRAARSQVSSTPAVEFLWAPAREHVKENADTLRRREADWIARRLRAVIDGRPAIVWDAKAAESGRPAARAAKLGDMAILFRALSNVDVYEEALRKYGLDYYLVGGHAFYSQQEIFDVLNLLRAINSTSDLVSLVGALRSGFFALADETIYWLSLHAEGLAGGLFASDYPAEIPPDQQARARFAAETIRELRQRKDRVAIYQLIDEALERTGYDAVLLDEFLGERKLANLRKLIEQARTFQRGDFFGLSEFIHQLTEFVVEQPKEPLAATHSEDTNVIRLMTIHQAKGLEFPIVVVPDVNGRNRGGVDRAHFDARLGPLIALSETADAAGGVSGHQLWSCLESAEEHAELHRLLYVAATRAADYLMLAGGVPAVGATNGVWTQLLARRFDLASGRFIGQLPAGEPAPQVKVTLQEPAIDKTAAPRRARADLGNIIDEVLQAPAAPRHDDCAVDPIAPDLGARRQYSFSRLAGTLHRQDRRPSEFDELGEPSIDPRGLGTLVHAVLAATDFGESVEYAELVRLHAKRHFSDGSPEIAEALDMIERFAGSPRARELAEAAECHAELEFLLGWPLDAEAPRAAAVGGFIDRLYRDKSGNWHVLDFKTNRVPRSGPADLAAVYEMQMLMYALASERILGVAPASVTLHFLRTGAEHQFAWNSAARQRAIELVHDAIAAASVAQAT